MKKTIEKEKDVSFNSRCKNYLNAVDPESVNYYSLLQTTQADIDNKIDLNEGIRSIFVAHDESFE